MTEVRRTTGSSGGVGLYATKEYQPGDVIVVEESPLVRLAPCSQEENEKLKTMLLGANNKKKDQNNHRQSSFWDTIDIPSDIPKEYHGTFRGLVQSGLCYAAAAATATASSNDKTKLLELYYPSITNPSEQEQTIVQIAKRALDYIKKNAVATNDNGSSSSSKLLKELLLDDEDDSTLLKVMLIWACNAFEGGLVYNTISRINHCCDPNAVVIIANNTTNENNHTNKNKQMVMAATQIHKGEEITISYLGTFLYCDKSVRQRILQQTKHFQCQCNRCTGCCSDADEKTNNHKKDIAASIPCSFCHPRSSSDSDDNDNTNNASTSSSSSNNNNELLLEEDVQYDDDQTVHYMCPIITTMSESNDSKVVYQCESCFQKFTPTTDQDADTTTNIFKITNSISDKVVSFLQDRQQQNGSSSKSKQPKAAVAAATKKKNGADKNDDDDDDDNDEEVEVLAEHLRGACMAYLGARHWATNLLLLLYLDTLLKEYHSELLSPQPNSEPDLERVAEFVDILERLYRFVDGLQLKIHVGHLLGHVTIGVARALVSLGDVKSQRYGKEWLDKIDSEYVQHYENDGIQKVVETLKVAWQRQQQDTGKPQAKRLKIS